ncbi:MAG: VOC family protein [Dehalococcoidia bacterium]
MVTSLGHVGIVCDDFLKMRDFYTRVIGLTITDEDPERGGCFLSGDPATEHHQLALGKVREGRAKTQNVGQISFIVDSLDSLRNLYRRVVKEGMQIDHVVTHGISCSVYFYDPEDNRIELYYKTGFIVKQGFSRPIDLEQQSNEEILAFSKSFEATEGPFQGAKLPVASAD